MTFRRNLTLYPEYTGSRFLRNAGNEGPERTHSWHNQPWHRNCAVSGHAPNTSDSLKEAASRLANQEGPLPCWCGPNVKKRGRGRKAKWGLPLRNKKTENRRIHAIEDALRSIAASSQWPVISKNHAALMSLPRSRSAITAGRVWAGRCRGRPSISVRHFAVKN